MGTSDGCDRPDPRGVTVISLLRRFAGGLVALIRRAPAERDLDEELRGYLENAIAEQVRGGLTRADAERAARLEMGGLDTVKEAVRAAGWERIAESLAQDVVYGARVLRRNPGFTIAATL